MLWRLALLGLLVISLSCKTTNGGHSKSLADIGSSSATPAERDLIGTIIKGHYGSPIPGAEAKFPGLVVSEEILNEFTQTLFTSEQQSSRTLFLELIAKANPPSNELQTYLVQEFSVMTNLIQQTLARLGPGIEIPLVFRPGN